MADIKIPQLAVDLLLNIINIIILFVIVKAIVYKPVVKFLNERSERVKNKTEEAERLLREAKEAETKRDEIILSGRQTAEKESAAALKKANTDADKIISSARDTAKSITQKAEADAKAEKEAAIASSKDDIAALAVSIAERILERETNEDDNKRIVDDFFGKEGDKL